MKRFYYPPTALWPDELRFAAGAITCFGLVLFATPQSVIFVLLSGLGLLFAWFGASTMWRRQIEVELNSSGIALRNRWGVRSRWVEIPWSAIRAIDLRYFSTRRDRSEGWLQLTIKSDSARISVDSRLIGFAGLVEHALRAAEANGIALNEATWINARRFSSPPRNGAGS
jgi:hypothetical protein